MVLGRRGAPALAFPYMLPKEGVGFASPAHFRSRAWLRLLSPRSSRHFHRAASSIASHAVLLLLSAQGWSNGAVWIRRWLSFSAGLALRLDPVHTWKPWFEVRRLPRALLLFPCSPCSYSLVPRSSVCCYYGLSTFPVRMFVVHSSYVHLLDVVASRCGLPFHLFMSEVADDGVVLGGVELEVPVVTHAGVLQRRFFWACASDGFPCPHDQPLFKPFLFFRTSMAL